MQSASFVFWVPGCTFAPDLGFTRFCTSRLPALYELMITWINRSKENHRVLEGKKSTIASGLSGNPQLKLVSQSSKHRSKFSEISVRTFGVKLMVFEGFRSLWADFGAFRALFRTDLSDDFDLCWLLTSTLHWNKVDRYYCDTRDQSVKWYRSLTSKIIEFVCLFEKSEEILKVLYIN